MAGDFMRPVVDIVDKLLMGGINVTVYNGQLDLIVDTMGNPPLFYLILGTSGRRHDVAWRKSASQARLTVTGQEQWVKELKWEGLPGFNKLRWTALDDPAAPGVTGAFYKNYRNFAFYWILKAGHMVRWVGGLG